MRISDWSSDVCSSDLVDLAAVEQQFARPPRLVVEAVAVTELGNIAVDQPHLIALHLGVAFGDRSLAEPKRFDLCTLQCDPRLEYLLDRKVEARAPVLGDDLLLVEFCGGLRAGHGET